MRKPVSVFLLLVALSVTGCSTIQEPTPAVVPIATFAPLPASAPSDAAVQPQELPETVSAWHGIPIMPGAIAGDGDEEAYVFIVQADATQIREYYEAELAKVGWQSFVKEDGDSSVMLMFRNDEGATLTISIISKDDKALVLLEE